MLNDPILIDDWHPVVEAAQLERAPVLAARLPGEGQSIDLPMPRADIAGDARLRDAIHQHYGERLRTSISVGRAHWAEFKPPYASLPGPRPKQFWAPHYGRVRVSSSGTGISSEQYNAGLSRAWRDFTSAVLARPRQQPLATLNLSGPGGIAVAWAALLDGSADPHEGFVVQL